MPMKSKSLPWTLALFCASCLGLFGKAQAQVRDIVVPAGTLLQCTLDEPKFSSATITAEDPFLCYPRAMQQFGQTVFPRGSYIVGHLEKAKDPGHFVGKGYLKLEFDRIGLPATDVPLNAKIIAVAHYNVDREGKIIGHGHATRDTVEWLMPPLWPWKVLTLPARGPRPTLKGETRVTLRVMDDFVVPQIQASTWHRFGEEPSSYNRPAQYTSPASIRSQRSYGSSPNPSVRTIASSGEGTDSASLKLASYQPKGDAANHAWPETTTLFALTDGTVFPVSKYWRDKDQLAYVISDDDSGSVALHDIDWSATTKLNAERNVRVVLRNAP